MTVLLPGNPNSLLEGRRRNSSVLCRAQGWERRGAVCRSRILKRHKILRMTDEHPDVLYHYTNLGGLNGILQSRRLWATDIRYLNDANELSYGIAEMCNLLEHIAIEMPDLTGDALVKYGTLEQPGEHVPDHSDPEALGPAHRAVYAAAVSLAALIDSSKPQPPVDWMVANGYVTCFTEKADSLGQWRGYAGGGGFAIGFQREALSNLTVPCWDYANGDVDPASHRWLDQQIPPPLRVEYGDECRDKQLRYADAALQYYIGSNDSIVPYLNFSISVLTIAVRICATLKDDAFEEEAEWRLVRVTAKSFQCW